METDNRPLAAARNIDWDALTGAFEQYTPALYNYVLRLCNNPATADQIVDDAFAKLKEHLSTGKVPKANVRLFLYKMVYHLIVNNRRFSYRSGLIEVIDLRNGDTTSISDGNRVLLDAVLRAILIDLTEDQRHVIILRFMEGFRVKETAAILGKTVANVKVIQNRAMATLRKALDYQEGKTDAISIMIRNLSNT